MFTILPQEAEEDSQYGTGVTAVGDHVPALHWQFTHQPLVIAASTRPRSSNGKEMLMLIQMEVQKMLAFHFLL